MEDILEAILVILGLIFAGVASASKKRKQQARPARSRAAKQNPSPAKTAPASASVAEDDEEDSDWAETIASTLPQAARPIAQAIAPLTADAGKAAMRAIQVIESKMTAAQPTLTELPAGASVTDDEGCIGGSLGPHSEEGESRKEHAQHLHEQQERRIEEQRQAESIRSLRAVQVQDLRRAVVMSEILDKPVALRRAPHTR